MRIVKLKRLLNCVECNHYKLKPYFYLPHDFSYNQLN